jgi:hypothetical protein
MGIGEEEAGKEKKKAAAPNADLGALRDKLKKKKPSFM